MTDNRAQEREKYLDMDVIAYKAAKEATREVFAQLGVNVDDPAQIEDFRRDLRFGGHLRKAADKSLGTLLVTGFISIVVVSVLTLYDKFKV